MNLDFGIAVVCIADRKDEYVFIDEEGTEYIVDFGFVQGGCHYGKMGILSNKQNQHFVVVMTI
jgi:hypothetical protein